MLRILSLLSGSKNTERSMSNVSWISLFLFLFFVFGYFLTVERCAPRVFCRMQYFSFLRKYVKNEVDKHVSIQISLIFKLYWSRYLGKCLLSSSVTGKGTASSCPMRQKRFTLDRSLLCKHLIHWILRQNFSQNIYYV